MAPSSPVKLWMTDFCPFAQRAWIAFLEKEQDPANPKLFNYTEVNYFNPDLPETQAFLKIHNTVPAGVVDGEVLRESMPVCEWVEAQWPQRNSLVPATPEGRERMHALLKQFTSGENDITAPFYGLLMEQDVSARPAREAKLLESYAALSRALQASGGPYLLGAQFTLADVAIIPFLQRALVLLPAYRAPFALPQTESYAALHAYIAAFSARPSVQISSADRKQPSLQTQPFGPTERNAYLLEVYAPYAHGLKDQVRAQLRHAPAGKTTTDIAAAKKSKDEAQTASKPNQ